jgi:hypothetical protein
MIKIITIKSSALSVEISSYGMMYTYILSIYCLCMVNLKSLFVIVIK